MVDVGGLPTSSSGFTEALEQSNPTFDRKMSVPVVSTPVTPVLIEEEEDISDYKQDGYHTVRLGDVYNGKYQVVRKLGWGHFSTVWLAQVINADASEGEQSQQQSHQQPEQQPEQPATPVEKYVALKIMRSAAHYTEAAWDEVDVLRKVKNTDPNHPGFKHVVTIEDAFIHKGPHGNHVCMAFEVLGSSLLSLMRRFNQNGVPEHLVKQITRQICLGLDYLHRVCGVIHTDLKPENILIDVPNLDGIIAEEMAEFVSEPQTSVIMQSKPLGHRLDYGPSSKITVKIADLGNGCWCDKHFSNDIQTREYRAPEIILGSRWGASVDMWSLACMVFELLTGDYLFEPQAGTRFSKNDDHIAQIIELLGRLPLSLLIQGQLTQLYFHQSGELRNIFRLEEWSLSDVFVDKYGYPRNKGAEICDFLLPLLSTNPVQRADAGGMSNHSWVAGESCLIDRPPKGPGSDIPGWVLNAD